MFRNDRNESLYTSQDGAMYDDGSCRRFIWIRHILGRAVFQVEAFRELEVELDGRTLEGTTQRVADRNVDLGPVERTVARI